MATFGQTRIFLERHQARARARAGRLELLEAG
jgi:hypothetical protein